MKELSDQYDIRTICKVIDLHHSVYYYHINNPVNRYEKANEELDEKILEVYNESKKRYGAPKIKYALENQGIKVSVKRVQRRMRELGIRSIVVKKYKPAHSDKQKEEKVYHNLLKQDFKADRPGIKLAGDITYIYTKEEGWTYLAVVIDLYDLKVIGYAYGLTMDDSLTIRALEMAVNNRHIEPGCIFHSDRGSQYTSNEFEAALIKYGMVHSYSKKGYPYDNACVESFNATLKKEEVNLKSYMDYDEARLAIFEFIESWYNRRRIHSSLGYITPEQKYQQYISASI